MEEEEGRTQMMEEEDGVMEEEKEEKWRVCIIESHDNDKSGVRATMNKWATSHDNE